MIYKVMLMVSVNIAIINYNNPKKLHLTNMMLAQCAPQKGSQANKDLTPS